MRINLTTLFLAASLLVSNIYSMDKLPEHKSTPPFQHSEHAPPAITPGMMTIGEDIPNDYMLLKIFGQGNHPVYETKLPIQSLYDVVIAKDGTLYIIGEDLVHHKPKVEGAQMSIYEVKNGKAPELLDSQFYSCFYVGFAEDGALLIGGEEIDPESGSLKSGIFELKNGKINPLQSLEKDIRPMEMQNGSFFFTERRDMTDCLFKLKDGKLENLGICAYLIMKLIPGPDESLFVQTKARYLETDKIVSLTKEGKTAQLPNYGLHRIDEFAVGPDGTFFILGSRDKGGTNKIILSVKNSEAVELPKYGSDKGIPTLEVMPDGTLFIRELLESTVPQYCVHKVKDNKLLDKICSNNNLSLTKIKGAMSLKDVLTKNEEEKVFPRGHKEGIDQKALEKVCTNIKAFAPSLFSHEDGKAFYHFFAPHVVYFQKQASDAGLTMHNLLEATAKEESLLYGYALALYFDVSGLEHVIITTHEKMSSEEVLKLKAKADFKKRLNETHEAQGILKAIVDFTTPDFSKQYKTLLEKVNAALAILEPQEQVRSAPAHAG